MTYLPSVEYLDRKSDSLVPPSAHQVRRPGPCALERFSQAAVRHCDIRYNTGSLLSCGAIGGERRVDTLGEEETGSHRSDLRRLRELCSALSFRVDLALLCATERFEVDRLEVMWSNCAGEETRQ